MQTYFTTREAQKAPVTDILSFMFTIISLSLSTERGWKTRLIWLQKLLSVDYKLYFPDDLLNSLNP